MVMSVHRPTLPLFRWSLLVVATLLIAARVALPPTAWAAPDTEVATFFRGLNLNGPPVEIDGHAWEGRDAKGYVCRDKAFENQDVPLVPTTDSARARMIRSSRWGGNEVTLTGIPAGKYTVFLYLWEDNNAERFSISLNGRSVVPRYSSGAAGHWEKLGPWPVDVQDGKIRLTSQGGAANFSGIEIWRGEYNASAALTPEQVEFFERRIRPVLVQHCYECHSADSKEVQGDLLVDSRSALRRGGITGPAIVPGDVEASLLIKAVRHADPDLQMPPESKLAAAEIADLEQWVRMNAPDPRGENTRSALQAKTSIDWVKAREHWSLRPLVRPAIPPVKNSRWPAGEIDRFILAELEAAGIAPSADADKPALLRRATFDLLGLPPTPAEIDAFVADTSPGAFATVVDRLLDSPQYGERWGRHWLDVVRYSDTAGDNSDFPIPQMYRYRNWVIAAFNRDQPYDEFVRDQLAGDLVGGPTTDEANERLIATGYIANARRFGSRVSDYPQHLTIEDTIDNVGRTFLGMTINCARCHNHKFDPITNDDYYALYGIFHSTRYPWPGIELEQKQRDLVPLASGDEVTRVLAQRKKQQDALDAETRRLEKERKSAQPQDVDKLKKLATAARKKADAFGRQALPFELAYAVAEASTIEDVALQQKGDPLKPGEVVPRHFLTVLGGMRLRADDSSSGRLQLASWIVDPANPLAARVMANRIWLYHFGKGIVPTPNDFGHQGKPPTHPALLDYLATRFIAGGWSVKSLHREIMLSHTYRLSSQRAAIARERDPNNDLLAAFPRNRLDAEAIRDALLVLGGNLDPSPGGPHPFPPQSEWKFTQHNPFKAVYDSNRRSVYLMTQRIQRHPYLAIFDGADPAASTPLRLTSTTPLQALYLLNDAFTHEQAQGFAKRLLAERAEDAARLELAYRLALGRQPAAGEAAASLDFLAAVKGKLKAAGVPANECELQSWQALARTIFRLNEFVYID